MTKKQKKSKINQIQQNEQNDTVVETTVISKEEFVKYAANNNQLENELCNIVAEEEVETEADQKELELEIDIKPEAVELMPNRKWYSQYEAVVGLSHRKSNPPLPCQDAAIAAAEPRAIIISADGAGSSAVSEIGSHFVTRGLLRFCQTLEKKIASLLDSLETNEKACKEFALLFVKHAFGILQDLSVEHRRPIKDFRCTLLMGLVGKTSILWLKIGDGALVAERLFETSDERKYELNTLGEVGKGEYANHTTFIDDNLIGSDIQIGIIPTNNVTALFCMSDGAAEKLVSLDGQRVSVRLSEWGEQLRNGKLSRHKLTESFYEGEFQKRHSGDDCSIAMISSEIIEI